MLAILSIAAAISLVPGGLLLANYCVGFGSCGDTDWSILAWVALPAIPLAIAGVGLLRLKNWARILAIALLCASPVGFIVYIMATPDWHNFRLFHHLSTGLAMLLKLAVLEGMAVVALVAYLSRKRIRREFGGRPVKLRCPNGNEIRR